MPRRRPSRRQAFEGAAKWAADRLFTVLIVSLVIPSVLAVYNQRAGLTKAVFDTDYKADRAKHIECDRLHSEYVTTASSMAEIAERLQKAAPGGHGDQLASPDSSAALAALLQTFLSTQTELQERRSKVSSCYADLQLLDENLALVLGLDTEYGRFRTEAQGRESPLEQRLQDQAAVRAGLSGMDERLWNSLLLAQQASEEDKRTLVTVLTRQYAEVAKVESGLQQIEQEKAAKLNRLFSEEVERQFHRGVLSYLGALWGGK